MNPASISTNTPESTIDALVWSLSTYRIGALDRPGNMGRFHACDAGARKLIAARLKEKCGWSDKNIAELKTALKRKNSSNMKDSP